ncbi:MAG: TIGR03619 family F420-dependent LLM class oxidoreductase [Myxococcota bacterium]
MSESIAISVTLCGLSRLFGDGLSGVVRAARLAEEAGVDQIVLPDHLAVGPRTDRYPYGRFPYPNEEPWLEPLTALAAIAGATRRIRLGTGVLIAPLRPALLLAKTLATLDALSDGRVDLGVGTGWQREEFAAAGVPFRGRTARLDDTLRACRVLWSEAPASFHSETVSFSDVWCLPRPVQSGGIPIWIGGALTEGNVGRIVEYGRGWMPMACGLEELEAGIARLRGAFAEAGRDPAGLEVRAAAPLVLDSRGRVDVERSLAALPRLREVGATAASFALDPFASRPADVGPFFERLGQLGA